MADWNVQPSWKKSVIERQYMSKDGQVVIVETGWRWGEFTCETEDDNPPLINEGDDLWSTEYNVEMIETTDGCWEEHEFYGFTEKQEEKMREWLENNSAFDLEEKGWTLSESEMIIDCEPEIERIDE